MKTTNLIMCKSDLILSMLSLPLKYAKKRQEIKIRTCTGTQNRHIYEKHSGALRIIIQETKMQ